LIVAFGANEKKLSLNVLASVEKNSCQYNLVEKLLKELSREDFILSKESEWAGRNLRPSPKIET
jgi:hypothetical protein